MMRSERTRRRIASFRANRRALWSLRIFLAIFGVSLVAEFVANDRPLLVVYEGAIFFPVISPQPETRFGGELPGEADFQDPYVHQLIAAKGGFVLMAPVAYSYRSPVLALGPPAPSPPSLRNLLGTDDQGRDVLARVIYGLRTSILFGLVLAAISAVIGMSVGAVQGYFGGIVDLAGQRFIEVWNSVPSLYLVIIIAAVLVPSFFVLLFILLLFSWVSLVGVVRGETLRTRKLDYVLAARALGMSDTRIIFRHVLPNSSIAAVTYLPFLLNHAITTLTALDFLGFGLPPGSASLGELLAQGKNNLHAPWLGLAGFLSVAGILTLLVFIGDGVRDALDPRKTP